MKRFIHFMERKLCVHGFICEFISVFISLSQDRSKGCFFKTTENSFCFLIEYLESCVFDLVDSLELFDDEFTIHNEMYFSASEFFDCCEPENCSHIFCLIVGRCSEEKFPSFYYFISLAYDKSTPAWAGVSSRSSICVHGVEHGQSFSFFI